MPKSSAEETGFNGHRFLMDAANARQYAVPFVDGQPKAGISIFTPDGKNQAFAPNDVILAFDDDAEISISPGKAKLSVSLFQIRTDGEGVPANMKICGCEYMISAAQRPGGVEIAYELSPASILDLAQRNLAAKVPPKFITQVSAAALGVSSSGDRTTVSEAAIGRIPFPPHHPEATRGIRQMIVNPPATSYARAGDQTLEQTTPLSGGEKLKTLFDFEARRVTEIFDGGKDKVAIAGHSFDEHDRGALEKAYQRLIDLRGKPRPLDDKKFSSLKLDKKP